jgi:hypothetical protein
VITSAVVRLHLQVFEKFLEISEVTNLFFKDQIVKNSSMSHVKAVVNLIQQIHLIIIYVIPTLAKMVDFVQ